MEPKVRVYLLITIMPMFCSRSAETAVLHHLQSSRECRRRTHEDMIPGPIKRTLSDGQVTYPPTEMALHLQSLVFPPFDVICVVRPGQICIRGFP
jgi:hypothetical protein